MGRGRAFAAAILAGVACLTAVPASAAESDDVRVAAKRAASRYMDRYAMDVEPADWSARCRRAGAERWTCRVSGDDGACSGTLGLVERKGGSMRRTRTSIFCSSAAVYPAPKSR